LYRRLEGTPGQRFEAPDGVGDVRHEKGQAQVLAVVADLRQQRVLSGTRVQLGHEFDSRLDARTIRASVEGLVAEILIDLPHTATSAPPRSACRASSSSAAPGSPLRSSAWRSSVV